MVMTSSLAIVTGQRPAATHSPPITALFSLFLKNECVEDGAKVASSGSGRNFLKKDKNNPAPASLFSLLGYIHRTTYIFEGKRTVRS